MYLNSFHNKLKTVYLNGKVNRRIDVLLDLLLKVEHDSFFQYELKHRLLQPNKVAFRVEDAHKRGMSISPKKVNVRKYKVHMLYIIIINLYYRKSLIHSGIYRVNLETTLQVILLPKCQDATCQEKCATCNNLCQHLYKCDPLCYDNANGHVCKHLHRIHSLLCDNVTEGRMWILPWLLMTS